MTSASTYCGFLCEEVTEKQQAIIDEILELHKVNPEFADEFINRMITMMDAARIGMLERTAFIQEPRIKSTMSSEEDRRPEGEEDPETKQPDDDTESEEQPPAGSG